VPTGSHAHARARARTPHWQAGSSVEGAAHRTAVQRSGGSHRIASLVAVAATAAAEDALLDAPRVHRRVARMLLDQRQHEPVTLPVTHRARIPAPTP